MEGLALILLLISHMEFYALVVSLGLAVTAVSVIVAKLNQLIRQRAGFEI